MPEAIPSLDAYSPCRCLTDPYLYSPTSVADGADCDDGVTTPPTAGHAAPLPVHAAHDGTPHAAALEMPTIDILEDAAGRHAARADDAPHAAETVTMMQAAAVDVNCLEPHAAG